MHNNKIEIKKGDKFNKLTAIRFSHYNKRSRDLWIFKCDCGGEKIAIRNKVIAGSIKSCGCFKREDITGKKFHRLTAIKFLNTDKDRSLVWLFKCDCGNYLKTKKSSVLNNYTKSCGCFQRDIIQRNSTTHGHTSNRNNSGAYRSWLAMKNRCNKDKNYIDVTYSEDWFFFENFYKDMGDRPKNKSLDRIDNSKGYSKENCRWSTYRQQAINSRKSSVKTYSSKYKGVTRKSGSQKFRARIGVNYKRVDLGSFDTEQEAALAYNKAAIKYYGDFAVLNTVVLVPKLLTESPNG